MCWCGRPDWRRGIFLAFQASLDSGWAEPNEIADAILYLAGPSASFITGHILMDD